MPSVRAVLWHAGPYFWAVVVLLVFAAFVHQFLGTYYWDLGSITAPAIRYAYFLLFWTVLGSLAALGLAVGFTRTARISNVREVVRAGFEAPDWAWMWTSAGLAFLLAVGLRRWVLHDSPLTDDESAYHFMAEVLASGRLTGPSPPMKLFFDRAFMVNDGRLYSQYFLGWPALLAPGVLVGVPGYMNAAYSAATIFPLFAVLRRIAGSTWAKLGLLLYLTSPMIMVAAATEMSHTSCLLALVTLVWAVLRASEDGASGWVHALVAVAFGLAFFIRPISALGVGLPALVAWGTSAARLPAGRRLPTLLWFLVPALVLAALFLGANAAQNGSAFKTAYQRYLEYSAENGYRFSHPGNSVLQSPAVISFANAAVAAVRLHFAAFGWPLLLFVPLAGGRGAVLFQASLALFFATNVVARDAGVDTFGPVHYFEALLPLIALTVLGARRTSQMSSRVGPEWDRLPAAACAALIAVGLIAYTPLRLLSVERIGRNIAAPFEKVRELGITNAVIFAPRPFVDQRPIVPTRHFVFWRPNNAPDLRNRILWVNHVTISKDKELMRNFPDRKGYVMTYGHFRGVRFLELSGLAADALPPGRIGGTGAVD